MVSNSRRPGLQSRPEEGAHLEDRGTREGLHCAAAKIDPILTVAESAAQGLVIRRNMLEQLHKAICCAVVAGLNAQPKTVMARSGLLEKIESL
jgi:hypothetical protein